MIEKDVNINACMSCGVHWIIELSGCDFSTLNNKKVIASTLNAVCAAGAFTKLNSVEHSFSPHGITMLYLLSESHISIHTWPEHGYAAIDVFTCGTPPSEKLIVEALQANLNPKHYDIKKLQRGFVSFPVKQVVPA
ncbi:adenosylmethionine decarboxylase [Halodesulfovibrio sp. MK-HDV]|jgi:S-adenosylmethionine decarboxylase|uniref:adenosylmethionine decarboxylase n=1 Tax=Halodesulfovibrio sp. MK-HDV TaxID=2599925 RepID=UPI0013FBDEFF|nr:adenosylmethionine decarboxylase [Halodesulfovibrio sp. MK-HDV]KAF1074114.1 S-adenosylmethionine decarboxylase proenzyme [Halodesulfovibrio sp. MK-HDV]